MLRFNSYLLALAGDFVGRFAPFQGVEVAAHPDGGVTVAAMGDGGRMAMIGHDPNGSSDEPPTVILPSAELTKACRGIKTAEREVVIDGNLGVVSTYHKAHSTSKVAPFTRSTVPFPPLRQVIGTIRQQWSDAPATTSTAGRYDIALLLTAIKAVVDNTDSIVITALPNGPLRLQREDVSVIVMLMPQAAAPIPPVPAWLSAYADQRPA